METDALLIYIDRLRGGAEQALDLQIPAELLELDVGEARYLGEVFLCGQAYLAGQELLVRYSLEVEVEVPCAVCNAMVMEKIALCDLMEIVPLEEIRSRIYCLRSAVRDELLLATPPFSECGGAGQCPGRDELARYMHRES